MKEFDVYQSRLAQEEYCKKEDLPHFAPKSGACWKCNRTIYKEYHWKMERGNRVKANEEESEVTTGISTERASTELVTGCPHCNISYCD